LRSFPAIGEKHREQSAALLGQNAAFNARVMIQSCNAKKINDAAMNTCLGIARTINNPADPCVHDRPGTHRARLKRHKQLTARQSVIIQAPRRIAQGGNFSMRRRIALANRRIEPAPDYHSPLDHDSPYRHLAQALGTARQGDRLSHEKFVAENGDRLID
jgi:hypothetical protein